MPTIIKLLILFIGIGLLNSCSSAKAPPSAASAFLHVASQITPDITPSEAQTIDYLVKFSPNQWDGEYQGINVYLTFKSDGTLILGRASYRGDNFLPQLEPFLTKKYGSPKKVLDVWGATTVPSHGALKQAPGIRSEIKLAFPGFTDLVYHSAYQPKAGDNSTAPRPPETTLRIGTP